ncbi:MAG: hypothetical protein JSR59_16830 [Proteobacteria bacterium]|nr:hypothetical protein [Pseudomonadota bacterium]
MSAIDDVIVSCLSLATNDSMLPSLNDGCHALVRHSSAAGARGRIRPA